MSEKNKFLIQYGTAEHLDKALRKHPDWYTVRKNPNLQPRHLQQLWDHSEMNISALRSIAMHPATNGDLLNHAARSEEWSIRKSAMSNPNATKEHLFRGMEDKHWLVRETALNRAHNRKIMEPEHYQKMMKDPDAEVSHNAKLYYGVYLEKKHD